MPFLSLLPNGDKRYRIQDNLGSTRVALTADGAVYDWNTYEPFGTILNSSGGQQNSDRLSYIGKEKDAESDLGDFGVRKYESETGRFLSVDPLWEKYRKLTPYHYCGNNPLTMVDRTGAVAEVVIQDNTITVSMHLVFYAKSGEEKLLDKASGIAEAIQSQYGNTFQMYIKGVSHDVKFNITYETKSLDEAKKMAENDYDSESFKNNYILLENTADRGITGSQTGGNNGRWNLGERNFTSDKAGSHEVSHFLGLRHSKILPATISIREPSGNIVNEARQVTPTDVRDILRNTIMLNSNKGVIGNKDNSFSAPEKE